MRQSSAESERNQKHGRDSQPFLSDEAQLSRDERATSPPRFLMGSQIAGKQVLQLLPDGIVFVGHKTSVTNPSQLLDT